MERNIICVFHQGFNAGQVTFDLRLRLMAAKELAEKNPLSVVCFLGGGGFNPIGSHTMREFWQKNYSQLQNPLAELKGVNNTAATIKKLAKIVQAEKYGKIYLVSNAYHKKRVSLLAAKFLPDVEIIGAEQILIGAGINTDEIKEYLNSFEHKIKELQDFFARLFLFFDPEQKIIEKWRDYTRH